MSYPMLDSDLEKLKSTVELHGKSFGVSRIQRYLKIGYNRAAHLVDAAIQRGVLVRDAECDWLVKLPKSE